MDELQDLMGEYEKLHPGRGCFGTWMYTGGYDAVIKMLKEANGREIEVEYPSVEILDGGVLVYVD